MHTVSWPSSKLDPQVPPHTVYGRLLEKVVYTCGFQMPIPTSQGSHRKQLPRDPTPRNSDSEWMGPWNLCCHVNFHSNFIIQPWLEPKSSPFPSLAIVIGFLLSPHNWCYCFKDLHNHLPGKKSSGPFKILGSLDFLETYDTDDKWQCSLSVYPLLPLFQGHQCWWSLLLGPLLFFCVTF